MSLKLFPGLYSFLNSPVHCLGLYNNVLLLFYVNICYWAGSTFFLPPTFPPVHCQRSVIWMKPFPEILPFTAASLAIISQAATTGLEGRQRVEVLLCVPRGPCSTSLTSPERAVPHLRLWVLYGWWGLSWDMVLQFLSSSFTLLQGWTS